MTEKQIEPNQNQARIEAVRNFLCGYQLCLDMLNLRRYERKRAYQFDDEFDDDSSFYDDAEDGDFLDDDYDM